MIEKETLSSNQFISVDGIKIRCVSIGSGPPLILLHTLRTQLEYFEKIIPELSEHFRMYLLDLPGHGYSDNPETNYDELFFREIVKGFMSELNVKDTVVLDESIGATIALSIANFRLLL